MRAVRVRGAASFDEELEAMHPMPVAPGRLSRAGLTVQEVVGPSFPPFHPSGLEAKVCLPEAQVCFREAKH